MTSAFDHVKTSAKEQEAAMTAVNKVMNQSGLDDEDLKDSLARLVTVTGSVTKAQKDMSVAADVARARGIDLAAATKIVEKAELGNVGALKRIGIEVPKVTAATDALKESHVKATQAQKDAAKAADLVATKQAAIAALQEKFGGAAEKYGQTAAGSMERFQVAAHNVEEELGAALLPTLANVAGGVATFINKFNEAEGAGAKFRVVVDGVKNVASDAFNALRAGFNAIDWGKVWDVALTKTKAAASKLGDELASFVRSINWNQVGDAVGKAIVTALNKLDQFIRSVNWAAVTRAIIEGFGKVVAAVGRFLLGVDWGAVLGKMFSLIVAIIKAQAVVMLTVAQTIGVAIIKGIGAGLVGILTPVKNALDNMREAVVHAAKTVYGNALGVGKAIVLGVVQGIYDIGAGAVKAAAQWLADLIPGWMKKLLGIGSPSRVMADQVGKPIVEGVATGMRAGVPMIASATGVIIAEVNKLQRQLDAINTRRESQDRARAVRDASEALAEAQRSSAAAIAEARKKGEGVAQAEREGHAGIRTAEESLARAREDIVVASITKRLATETAHMDKLKALIDSRKEQLATAFTTLADYAGRGFEAKTKYWVDKVTARFDELIAQAQAAGGALTPSEQALKDLDRAEAERSRSQALSAATASGDPEQIRQAQLAIQRAALEDQAAVERTALDQATQVRVAALEAAKTQELQNLNERRDNLSTKLDEQLTILQTKLAAHPEQYSKIQRQIVKLLNEYGIDYKKAGLGLGRSFAQGLDAAEGDVRKAARNLAKVMDDNLHARSPTKEGPMSTLDTWFKKVGSTLASGLDTGAITKALGSMAVPAAPGLAAAGLSPGLAPAAIGGVGVGAPTVELHIGTVIGVGGAQQLAEIVRKELIGIGRRNGNVFGAVA